MQQQNELIARLRQYATLAELKNSAFFAASGGEIESLLGNPEIVHHRNAVPRLSSFLRVVQWNIEKGIQFPQVLESLKSHAVLRWADVILLNEADRGTPLSLPPVSLFP